MKGGGYVGMVHGKSHTQKAGYVCIRQATLLGLEPASLGHAQTTTVSLYLIVPAAKRKQALLRLPRWSPTLVLTELDDA